MAADAGRIPVIAIDGPAGSGKSTVARRVAEAMGYRYLDSGAMYRTATWKALRDGVDMADEAALVDSTRNMEVSFDETENGIRVLVNGRDISMEIRHPDVTRNIQKLDALPGVRSALGALQRQQGEARPTVAEGRDMGTVIFPDAACKIFLDADPAQRAKRRQRDLEERGISVELDELQEEMTQRDEHDQSRETSPLVQAPDAHRIDTTDMTIGQVVDAVLKCAKECGL